MLTHKYSIILVAASTGTLVAQASTPRCSTGPGTVFGVQGLQCGNCVFKQVGDRWTYTFYAEPTVTQAASEGDVMKGDVVEAVDGMPITTQAGADVFAYPRAGDHTLTVRRGRDRRDIRISLATTCYGKSSNDSWGASVSTSSSVTRAPGGFGGSASGGSAGTTRASSGGAGFGGATVTGSGGNLTVTSGTLTVAEGYNNIDDGKAGRFGFAVNCHASCPMQRRASADSSYRFDRYPTIIAVRERSAADRAGLRVGDVITRVNGRSILQDEGALQRAEQQEQVRLTVFREGKGDLEVLLLVTR